MENKKRWDDPARIFDEYKHGKDFKAALNERGMYEQDRINERFYIGDQWHAANCGDEKPLTRYNIVKRIGDYKMSMVGSADVAVSYSAEGVPSTKSIRDSVRQRKAAIRDSEDAESFIKEHNIPSVEMTGVVMSSMSDYFKTTAERVKLNIIKNKALRKAYITGTGVLYTYWDDRVRTGLYVDAAHKSPIVGDIRCEVLDIENVYFGDPNLDDVQEQPYIIIAQRKNIDEVKRIARRRGRPSTVIDKIHPDEEKNYLAGNLEENEPTNARKTTVLTKLYKKWDDEGKDYTLMAVEVAEGVVIRPAWDMKIRLYPIAKISWEEPANCIYGDSEVTHLIPNQITINRTIVAATQALIREGMPIMLVNGDIVQQPITNDPGQIIPVHGTGEDIRNAVRYVQPPAFTTQFDNMVNSLIANTLTQSGANDAALGDIRPDNTSAIIAVREAATMPMQLLQNRFYSFIEDVARIWAEFWVTMYGKRMLKIEDEDGVWYMPFDGNQYKELIISARVDVGAAGLWSEIQSRQTLDNMLTTGIIDPVQYLSRLPKGSVPDLGGLLRDYQQKAQPQLQGDGNDNPPAPSTSKQGGGNVGMTLDQMLTQLSPEYQAAFAQMTPEKQAQVLQQVQGTM